MDGGGEITLNRMGLSTSSYQSEEEGFTTGLQGLHLSKTSDHTSLLQLKAGAPERQPVWAYAVAHAQGGEGVML